jgi:hypothetical protein
MYNSLTSVLSSCLDPLNGVLYKENSKHSGKYVRFEVFTAVTMKNCVSGMLRRVALVRTT